MAEHLNTISEASDKLRIGRTLTFRAIKNRELVAVKIGRRTLIPDSSIDSYIERLKERANA